MTRHNKTQTDDDISKRFKHRNVYVNEVAYFE